MSHDASIKLPCFCGKVLYISTYVTFCQELFFFYLLWELLILITRVAFFWNWQCIVGV